MRKLTLRMAIITALLPASAYPLGLGEIELKSALNQDLNAEIEVVSAEPEDAEQLIVKMASRDAFSRAGLDRPFMLQQIKFKTVVKNGKPVILVYSKKPIREPFLSFLLEIDWPEGHLLREYTMLLDPPVYASPRDSASADSGRPFIDPADHAAPAQSAPQSAPASSQYVPAAAPASEPAQVVETPSHDAPEAVSYNTVAASASYPTSDNYRVKANDTLWSLANKMRPDSGVSVEQMMLALVRENPETFIKKNINGLKRGYILRIPDRDQITTIDRQQALAEVRQHANLWREYRQAMSGVAPASSMPADSNVDVLDGEDAGSGVEGQLSIVGAGEKGAEQSGASQDPNAEVQRLRQQLAMAQEALESKNLENNELSGRLAELEQRVAGVLDMNDGELAKLQDDLKAEPAVQAEAPQVEAAPEVVEDVETSTATEEVVADTALETVDSSAEAELVADDAAAEPAASGEEAIFVDENNAAETDVVEAEVEAVADVMPAQPEPAPAFAQTKPKSFIQGLLDDPKMLGIAGGAVVLVLGLIALLMRRRRVNKDEETWDAASDDFTALDDVADTATDNMNTAAMDAISPDDTSRMMVDDADSKTEAADDLPDDPMLDEFDESILDEPEADNHEDTVISLDNGPDDADSEGDDNRDDVIAEADVYLAYGIYQQAEELLKTAIENNADRDDYRMKLLETYFAGKNADAFTVLAEDVQTRKGDDKSYWDRVIVMGKELCPGNDLFSGEAPLLPDFDSDDLLPQKPASTDFELDAGDEPDLDLGLDDSMGLDESTDSDATQILSEPVDLSAMGEPADSDDEDIDLGADLADMLSGEEGDADTEESDSDLEFDLGDFDEEMAESDESDEKKTDDDEISLDIEDDFSLDFEASDLGLEADESDEAETTADDAEADTDSLELDESESSEESVELDADLDLSVALDEESSDVELEIEESFDEDLDDVADLDIELPDDDAGTTKLNDTVIVDSLDLDDEDDDFDISELSEDVDEVSTKLDLARAYMDMGDNEGAMSILQEVKQEGNEEQQKEADELIGKAS